MTASADVSSFTPQHRGFARLATWITVYLLLIILFGAWVRITGSGAGCGEHWPTCHGQVIPISPSQKTVIEYTHRVTSGLLGPLVIGQWLWSWFGAGRRSIVRWLSGLTLLFVIIEALIGAGLVLRGLVADNASVGRALVIAIHLANTLLLTSCASATAWLGAGRPAPTLSRRFPGRGALWSCLGLVVLLCMTGAVTALGDTLFPAASQGAEGLLDHFRVGLSSDVHFLVRLRVLHPILALGVGFWAVSLLQRLESEPGELGKLARYTAFAVWLQLGVGLLNIMLSAPSWMQLIHLLIAQLVWIGLTLTAVSAQTEASQGSSEEPSAGQVRA